MLNASVLVLNKYFQLTHVTTVKRAMTLLFSGKAKVVQDDYRTYDWEEWEDIPVQPDDRFIATPSKKIAIPYVIQLVSFDKVKRIELRFSRANIFARDKNRCQYCGKRYMTHRLSLDHVMPQSRGGKSTWENIVCACLKCNVEKGDRTPEEARMPLLKQPARPMWSPVQKLMAGKAVPKQWSNFIDEAYWNAPLRED
jgi:5-methylcytosine-specific restriction endonuclease McrA